MMMMRLAGFLATAAMLLLARQIAGGDTEAAALEPYETERWEIGLEVTAPSGPAAGIQAAFPIPTQWPEQEVRVVEKRTSPHVTRLRTRKLKGGATQMVATIARLAPGETAEALIVFEIAKSAIRAPQDASSFTRPNPSSRQLRPYLQPSPLIESDNRQIEALSQQIVGGQSTAYGQVEAIYDWVQQNIRYVNGPIKGALAALRDKSGDCEEMTSLFIALCRAADVPARTVWVPGHCYPEFYLEDSEGRGHWLPCQAAGARQFGAMDETRPIFQKGDNVFIPEQRRWARYASAVATSVNRRGLTSPQLKMLVRRLDSPQ